MLIVIVVAVVLIRRHVPPALPAPSASNVHDSTIQITVSTSFQKNAVESWQLIHLPSKQYEVLIRHKGQIAGKFNTTTLQSKNAAGSTYQAAGTVTFGSQLYAAQRIHIDSKGKSGYIIFQKTQSASSASNH